MADIYYKNCAYFHVSNTSYGSGLQDTSHCNKEDQCDDCESILGKAHPSISDGGCPVDCEDFEYTQGRIRHIGG